MSFVEWLIGTKPPVETRSVGPTFSISDSDALAEYLGIGTHSLAGVSVTEKNAFGATAFYRAVSIVAGTVAGLPLKTYRTLPDDTRERVASFADSPAGPYPLTPFAWKEMVMLHLLVRGEAFLQHLYNGGGALVGMWPTHPSSVTVRWVGAEKEFKVSGADGSTRLFSSAEMTHVMGLTMDGLRGISPLSVMRNAIGTGLAGEHAAARSFGSGLLISGIVSPEEDISEDDARIIKEGLSAKMSGVANAGDIAVVNRKLNFEPWSMTNDDAQFLESREFQVAEFARMFGVPPHLLGQTEKSTSFGTGIEQQGLGLARYTLMAWTARIEEALSALLPSSRFVEFDYSGLLQGTPQSEVKLLIEQVNGGLLTPNEARRIRNLPPVEGGDELRKVTAAPSQDRESLPPGQDDTAQEND